jgi:hypothetical protein
MTKAHPPGNRCGHDPRRPRLSPPEAIKKGPGAPPRILSLALNGPSPGFFHPGRCRNSRPAPTARPDASVEKPIVLEARLKRLDLASLYVGTPTPADGFVVVDMKTIVSGPGLGHRRC